MSNNKQSGVALITVLLVLAIAVVLAFQLLGRLQVNIARTQNIKMNNQAYWYAVSAEEYAKGALVTLLSLTKDNINLSQQWAQAFEFPVEGGMIQAQLTDLQACFNVNAINSAPSNNTDDDTRVTKSQAAFQRLLEDKIEDSYTVDTIRDALIDWIDSDTNSSSFGAEDPIYESLTLPYLAANNLMSHISEFRLLNGIDDNLNSDKLKQLLDVLCVVPENNVKLNVNTLEDENAIVLAALLGESVQVANDIISSRPDDGFDDIADFFSISEVEAANLNDDQRDWFAITTQYFRLDTIATFQSSRFKMSTVFKFEGETVTVINREFGGAF